MNNGLTESERALNCIIENYINELQRNTCDDDEEDLKIYKEKMDYITSLKGIIFKDLEILEIFKKHLYYEETTNLKTSVISKENYIITIFKALHTEDFNKIKEWLGK